MPAQSTMTERMLGAAKLDIDIYEEVEHDETATGQAAGVVAMVAADATWLFYTYATEILRGIKVPHHWYWNALAELMEEGREEADRQRALEKRFESMDFDRDIRLAPGGYSLREIAEEARLSRTYMGEMRCGETTPSLKHWPSVTEQRLRPRPSI